MADLDARCERESCREIRGTHQVAAVCASCRDGHVLTLTAGHAFDAAVACPGCGGTGTLQPAGPLLERGGRRR